VQKSCPTAMITVDHLRAAALVEHLPLVSYTVLLEPPYPALYVSPQLQPAYGYAPEDCLGSDDFWFSRIHRDDASHYRAAFARLRETDEQMSVEYRVAAADGREVWVRDVAVAAREADGTLVAHGYFTDITREKALERDLAAERAQAAAFFRDSAVGLAITDVEGRYLRVNAALARLNGAPPAEHVGRTLAEVAPAIAERIGHILAEVALTGTPVHQQEVVIETNREERTVLLSVFPLLLGGVPHFGRIVVDITEQRRAERERAAAEQQYRRLIEQLPLVTYVNEIEPVRTATFVSPQIEEIFGYSPAEFVADPTLGDRVIHPDDLARIAHEEEIARENGEPVELEYRIVRKDGSVRWVLDLMETVLDDDGMPLFEQGFLIDVTERHESESLFRAVFESAFEAVIITDDEGGYVDVNPAACELFGRTRDELLASVATESEFRAFVAAGASSGDYVVVRADGEERETEYAAKANVLPGRHLSVLRDVTSRRQLEQDLWRAQKLESVGRLAGGVAHDFNNMLTAIRGHAQLLEGGAAPGSAERRHAEAIDRAAERAASLTAQLLAFGRRQTLQTRAVDLNRLLERLEDMLRRLVDGGAELAFELEPALDAVRVDPSQIEQVLLNLVANAADATAGRGRILLRTRNVEVEATAELDLAPGRYAVVAVEDTGAGIDGSTFTHLFEPFFTTKPVGDGTGLGLATAYGIVKQSGGTIDVTTTAGRGSTFAVYLPQVEPQGATILVAEPDAAVRDVVFELLSAAGHRVLAADGPAAAARIAGRLEGGIDLLVGGAVDGVPAGRTLVLQKPYTPEHLRAEVDRALALP
jgi:two-component system cell cycle sensor histidine kinase/response regulator CckA